MEVVTITTPAARAQDQAYRIAPLRAEEGLAPRTRRMVSGAGSLWCGIFEMVIMGQGNIWHRMAFRESMGRRYKPELCV